MRKIAILGGTFDPVHWGHVLVAETAASQFGLDRVIWVPDRSPPHKGRPDLASFEQRREMLALAIADRPDFLLSPPEANPRGSSFAIETLLTLPKWHRCSEIGGLCDWLVAPRPSQGDGETGETVEIGGVSEWGDSPGGKPLDSGGDRMQVQANAVGFRVAEQMALL